MRLLIAEDDPVCLLLARTIATQMGYEVAVAESGLEAEERFKTFKPDVFLTDWLMPEVTGIELCRFIRDTESEMRTYIIVMTALTTEEDHRAALAAGADDVLPKPISRDDLQQRLHAAETASCGRAALREARGDAE